MSNYRALSSGVDAGGSLDASASDETALVTSPSPGFDPSTTRI
jgi:hypothetical protein